MPVNDSKCRQRRLNVAQWTPHSHSDWLSHRRPGLLTRQALRATFTLQHTFASGRGTDRRGGCCEKGFRKLCLTQIPCNFDYLCVFGLRPSSQTGARQAHVIKHVMFGVCMRVFGFGQDRINCSNDRDSDTQFGLCVCLCCQITTPFDSCSMTRAAVVYEHDLLFRSPSDRIGSYLSPHAIMLTKTVLKETISGSMFSSPMPPKVPLASI